MTALIIGLGVVILVIAIAATQRSGPRVTHITRRRETEDREDGDDA